MGGRPKSSESLVVEEGSDKKLKPSPWLKLHINGPQKKEHQAAAVKQIQTFFTDKAKELGVEVNDQFIATMQRKHFTGVKSRVLTRLWNQKEKASMVEKLKLGSHGSDKQKGAHKRMDLHMGRGFRVFSKDKESTEGNKKSPLWMIFRDVNGSASGGQGVTMSISVTCCASSNISWRKERQSSEVCWSSQVNSP